MTPATTKYVVIATEPPRAGWVAGARSMLEWAESASPNDHDEWHVVYHEGERQSELFGRDLFSVPAGALQKAAWFLPGLRRTFWHGDGNFWRG